MEQRKNQGKPAKKPAKTTLIMAAGLLGILLIGISPMLKTDNQSKLKQEIIPSAEEYDMPLFNRKLHFTMHSFILVELRVIRNRQYRG